MEEIIAAYYAQAGDTKMTLTDARSLAAFITANSTPTTSKFNLIISTKNRKYGWIAK